MALNLSAGGFPILLSQLTDFALSPAGDLIVGPDGDLLTVTGPQALLQAIIFRIKTHEGDAYYDPQMGASLDDFIGWPLSSATGTQIENQITQALTYDGLFNSEDITYLTFPTPDGTGIQLFVTLDLGAFPDAPGQTMSLPLTIDLQEGLLL